MKVELNENDKKLLGFCYDNPKTLSEIARAIGIDIKNISVRIPRLENKGLITVEKIGRRKYIRSVRKNNLKEYFLRILTDLKSQGSEMKYDDFMSLIPFDPDNFDSERYSAPLKLLWLNPKLVEQYVKLTPEGERVLKEETLKVSKSTPNNEPENP